jgi:squalene-associated FAD-dependent desaturase
MQKKVLVIGGGFAGLIAAAYLSNNNYRVTLLESSPKLGGRAYSFIDRETNTIIDNGQHILMGCYFETINFLSMIGATKNFDFQKRLKVNFVKEGFKVFTLKNFSSIYPFNLMIAALNYNAMSFCERLKLIKIFFKLPFYSEKKIASINIKQWLEKEDQSQNAQDAFWRILAVGALNTSLEKASARIFVDILRQIFMNGTDASVIILPKFGLSESYCNDAENFIKKKGGEIILSETVSRFVNKDNRITEVHTSNKIFSEFDFVLSAIPAFALARIVDENFALRIPEFTYSTVLNVYIWLKVNSFPQGFFGLINSPLHWVFNKGTHLNIVISDAEEIAKQSDEELIKLCKVELQKFFLIDPSMILNYKIIKEKRATFIPSNDILDKRPQQKTKIKNLVLAGDWVDTGLPSTIESAVKSGRVAAEIILREN